MKSQPRFMPSLHRNVRFLIRATTLISAPPRPFYTEAQQISQLASQYL